ncbi:MAG: flagellar export chaperone FliS [Nitrospiraceae bacterium]|nr:flagellar export chaperone FliS [Nitrospiraceae bacterium]MDA8263158.1 flagellar export chaperone FliS [Actinomycetota bacterium]
MAFPARARSAYNEASILSCSPRKQLIMLYDRLIGDLVAAGSAFDTGDLYAVHNSLRHAQDIVHLLMTSLRTDLWEGAAQVRDLYQYALHNLVMANLKKDRSHLDAAEAVLVPLGEAWRGADRNLDQQEAVADGVA